jgi:hypothetical protein
MNGKNIASIVLLMIVAAFVYCSQIASQTAQTKRDEADNVILEATTAKNELDAAQIATTKLKVDSDELIKFLGTWSSYTDRIQSQANVEEALQASLRSANLLILSQKFDTKPSGVNPVIPKVVYANLTIEDDYAKTLNWIGEIERRMPIARLVQCRILGGENGRHVRAELAFEVPLFDLKADPVKRA